MGGTVSILGTKFLLEIHVDSYKALYQKTRRTHFKISTLTTRYDVVSAL